MWGGAGEVQGRGHPRVAPDDYGNSFGQRERPCLLRREQGSRPQAYAGTQFTCFTGTKVQILTQKAAQENGAVLFKNFDMSKEPEGFRYIFFLFPFF